MNRREAVKLTSLIMGAGVATPVWLSALQSCSPEKSTEAGVIVFSDNQADIISEFSKILIPKTNTPGAIEAGVPDFIEKFVINVYTDDQRKRFMDGLDKVDKASKESFGSKFMKLTQAQRNEMVSQLNQDALKDHPGGSDPRQGPFFLMFKEAALLGFFTSMPGATQTLQYLPVPGVYNGCMPLSEVGRAWATS